MSYLSEFDEDIFAKESDKQPNDELRMSKKSKLSKKLRYDVLRLSLVDAIITSSECPGIDGCTSPDCCLDLGRIARQFGLITLKRQSPDDYSDRCLKYKNPELASKNAAAALEYLSFQHEVKRYANDHKTYELLIEINANPLASVGDYFDAQNWREPYDDTKSRQLALKRQIAYVLVSLAFPDSYLENFADRVNTDDALADDKQDDDQSNWVKWCKAFEEIEMSTLQLPQSITNKIEKDQLCTFPFGEVWPPEAGYFLGFGSPGGLKAHVEEMPNVPDCFKWMDRGNEAGTFGGFLVRTKGLLVSQTWTFERESNEFYINVFNEHLAPFFDVPPQSEFDHVIVVYSDYNIGRYIASTDPRSWSPNAPDNGISTPLPDGYGLVDNWDSSYDNYQPRPLASLDSDLFTPRLRSAARYLSECIRHDQQRPAQMFGDKMIEDGYFVSFFENDEAKKQQPRNIIVIKNGKVSFYINPKESEVNKKWLFALQEKLSKLEDNKTQYEFEASLLENFWDWNGYTPNPSDFIEPDKYDGKYDSLIKKWG